MSLLSRSNPGKGRLRRDLEEMTHDDLRDDLAAFEDIYDKATQFVPRDIGFMRSLQAHADRLDLFYEKAVRVGSATTLPLSIWDNSDSRDIAKYLGMYLTFCVRRSPHVHGNAAIARRTLVNWVNMMLYLANHHLLGPGSRGTGRPPSAARGVLPDGSDSLATLVKAFIPTLVEKFDIPKKAKPTVFWGREEAFLLCRSLDYLAIRRPQTAHHSIQMKAMLLVAAVIGSRTHSASSLPEASLAGQAASVMASAVTIYQPARHVYDISVSIVDTKGHSRADHDVGDDHEPTFPAAQTPGQLQLELATALLPLLLAKNLVYAKTADGKRKYFPDADAFLASQAAIMYVGALHDDNVPLFTTHPDSHSPVSPNHFRERLNTRAAYVHLPHAQPYNFRHGAGHLIRVALGPDAQRVALAHAAPRDDTGRRHYYKGASSLPIADIVLGNWSDLPADARQRLQLDLDISRRRPNPAACAVVALVNEPEIESLKYSVLRDKATSELNKEEDFRKAVEDLEKAVEARADEGSIFTRQEQVERIISLRIWRLHNDELRRLKRVPSECGMTVRSTRKAYDVLDSMLESCPPLFSLSNTERPSSLEAEVQARFGTAAPALAKTLDDATFLDDDGDDYDEPADMRHALASMGTSPDDVNQVAQKCAELPKPSQPVSSAAPPLADVDASDDDMDADDEPGATSALARQRSIAPERCKAIAAQFDLLASRSQLGMLVKWARDTGSCPLCPMHVAGFVGFRPSGVNYASFHPSTRGQIGATATDVTVAWMVKHLATVHPEDLKIIQAGKGNQLPWRCAPTTCHLDEEELHLVAQYLNEAEDGLKLFHGGITTTVSEQKLGAMDWAQHHGLDALCELYETPFFP